MYTYNARLKLIVTGGVVGLRPWEELLAGEISKEPRTVSEGIFLPALLRRNEVASSDSRPDLCNGILCLALSPNLLTVSLTLVVVVDPPSVLS